MVENDMNLAIVNGRCMCASTIESWNLVLRMSQMAVFIEWS